MIKLVFVVGIASGFVSFGLRKVKLEELQRQGFNPQPGSMVWQVLGPKWVGPIIAAMIGFIIAGGIIGIGNR